jgi:hypothetical protein
MRLTTGPRGPRYVIPFQTSRMRTAHEDLRLAESMTAEDPTRARVSSVTRSLLLAASASFVALPSPSSALSLQEALLRAKPAVTVVSAELTLELLKRLSDQIVSRDTDPVARPDPPLHEAPRGTGQAT